VVPLSYFIEQRSRTGHAARDLLVRRFCNMDYQVPVEPLRAELQRIVEGSPLWDKRVCGLQVTNLTDRSMELRCLMSSGGSAQLFDLRCIVREKMIEFVKENYPGRCRRCAGS